MVRAQTKTPHKLRNIPTAPPKRLSVVARLTGPSDPHQFDLAMLIPRRTRVRQVWFLHGGTKPDQVLVEWTRTRRPFLYDQENSPRYPGWGLWLWTLVPPHAPTFAAHWKAVALPVLRWTPGQPDLSVIIGDVTSDRHPDVLLDQNPGTNHDCGPHQVFATLGHGTVWRVFYRPDACEMPISTQHGLLALQLARGPEKAICCPPFTEKFLLHWNGHRYETASDRLVRNHD